MSELSRVLTELWSERARVGLVSLGVLWGTLSLGMLLAFGRSMIAATNETADGFGVDLLRVGGAATTRPFEGLPAGRPIGLVPADAVALRGLPGVRAATWEYSWGGGPPVRVGDVRRNVPVAGVGDGFGEMRNHRARPGGRFLNARDLTERRRVCFLGDRIARELFGDAPPVGRTLELDGTPLTVVGVGPPRIVYTNYNGEDQDKLTLPATTFADLTGWRWISHAWVSIEPGFDSGVVLATVRRALAARRRFDPADEAALDVNDYVEIRAMIDGILVGNSAFTLVVGVLGLLVSIVGVMNVMIALVEERTRELGVQLALGAPPAELAAERVTEAIVVTTLGGVAGLVACALLLAGLGRIDLPPEVLAYLGRPRLDPLLGGVVLAVLVVAGALAGWVPARRALRLDPVEVLREE